MRPWMIIILTRILWSNATPRDDQLPCDFFDSMNISHGLHFENKSIIIDDIEYLRGEYAQINYVIINGDRVTVKPHERGCTCGKTKCIQMCCAPGKFTTEENMEVLTCNDRHSESTSIDDTLSAKLQKFGINRTDTFERIENRPCKQYYLAEGKFTIDSVSVEFILHTGISNTFCEILEGLNSV